jgi:hypothetical protein
MESMINLVWLAIKIACQWHNNQTEKDSEHETEI